MNMKFGKLFKKKSNIIFIILPLFALLISLKVFIGLYNINILTIVILFLVFIYRYIIIGGLFDFKYSIYLVIFLFTYFVSNIININNFRITSFIYSILFIFLFEEYKKYIKLKQNYNYVKYIFSLIYILYGIMTIIQYFLIKIDSPYVPNLLLYEKENSIRVNSFATEPSYAGIIIVSLFYLNNIIFNNHNFNIFKYKKDFINFIIFIIIIILINSSYGFISLFILILYLLLKTKNIKLKISIFLLIIFLIIIVSNYSIYNYSINRIKNIINILPLISSNYQYLLEKDHSAAMRIVPNIIYFNMLKNIDFNIIMGFGMDYSQYLMARIIPGIGEQLRLGFFPMFLMNFGLVPFFAFLIYLFNSLMVKKISFLEIILQIVIITLTFTNANINTTLFWGIIFILYTGNNYIIHDQSKDFKKGVKI